MNGFNDRIAEYLPGQSWQISLLFVVVLGLTWYAVELAKVRARPELLESLTRETGGMMLRLDATPNEMAAALGGSQIESASYDRKPIWDSWVWPALIVGLLTSEWIVRRRGGLA